MMVNIGDAVSYVIAVIGCVIGVLGYFSSIRSKSEKSGMMLEKIDRVCRTVEDLKVEIKDNSYHVDKMLDNHTERIIRLEDRMGEVEKKVEVIQ